MADPRLYYYQIRNITCFMERMMLIDFSNILEVKELRRKLIEEITENLEFHVEMHKEFGELHDCAEYESREKFGRKMLRIIDETIRELENEIYIKGRKEINWKTN